MTRVAPLALCALLAACGSSAAPSPGPSAGSTTSTAATTATPTPANCLSATGTPAPPMQSGAVEVPAIVSIQFLTAQRGWAAGRGRILTTADGGATWTPQYLGPEPLLLVDFVDASTGWAVGLDALFGTTDGGRCWQRLGEASAPLVSVHFVGPHQGWGVTGAAPGTAPNGQGGPLSDSVVLGDGPPVQPKGGSLVTTTDGGATWTPVSGAPGGAQSVCFSDPSHGWLGAAGRLYRSGDAGATWSPVAGIPPQFAGGAALSLECSGPDSVWLLLLTLEGAAGNSPYAAYASADGGPLLELFEDMLGGSVDRPNPGSYPGPFSVIDAATAAFAGWTPPLPGTPVGFEEARVTGAQVSVSTTVHVPGVWQPWSAAFLDATTGWLVAIAGAEGQGSDAVILATHDGGRTWKQLYDAGK